MSQLGGGRVARALNQLSQTVVGKHTAPGSVAMARGQAKVADADLGRSGTAFGQIRTSIARAERAGSLSPR
jgi:hypothetical protein